MLKHFNPTSPGMRDRKALVKKVDHVKPHKLLIKPMHGSVGKTGGSITSRFREQGSKKHYRIIDFKREKFGIEGKVESIQHDPNRGSNIALISYRDGEKRYILAPEGLEKGAKVISGPGVEPVVGNCMPLSEVPLGMQIHNIELNPKQGASLVRGAGGYAQILAKEGEFVNIKLPSGEVKKVLGVCYATIGVLSNADLKNTQLGKAGRMRYLGHRPHVRGVAMADPHHDHPHAGKYGTSGIGKSSPMSPWGWKTRGVKTRSRVHTDYTLVKRRKGR